MSGRWEPKTSQIYPNRSALMKPALEIGMCCLVSLLLLVPCFHVVKFGLGIIFTLSNQDPATWNWLGPLSAGLSILIETFMGCLLNLQLKTLRISMLPAFLLSYCSFILFPAIFPGAITFLH
jgi:hypothetical protein